MVVITYFFNTFEFFAEKIWAILSNSRAYNFFQPHFERINVSRTWCVLMWRFSFFRSVIRLSTCDRFTVNVSHINTNSLDCVCINYAMRRFELRLTECWHDADGMLTRCWHDADGMLTECWRQRWPHSYAILTGFWRDSDGILTAFWPHNCIILKLGGGRQCVHD